MSDTSDFALARYNVDGSLDASFGAGGGSGMDGRENSFALARYVVGRCCTVEGRPPGDGPISSDEPGKPSPVQDERGKGPRAGGFRR